MNELHTLLDKHGLATLIVFGAMVVLWRAGPHLVRWIDQIVVHMIDSARARNNILARLVTLDSEHELADQKRHGEHELADERRHSALVSSLATLERSLSEHVNERASELAGAIGEVLHQEGKLTRACITGSDDSGQFAVAKKETS